MTLDQIYPDRLIAIARSNSPLAMRNALMNVAKAIADHRAALAKAGAQ